MMNSEIGSHCGNKATNSYLDCEAIVRVTTCGCSACEKELHEVADRNTVLCSRAT